MADNLQDIIDSLIDHIDKAIAKGSVRISKSPQFWTF